MVIGITKNQVQVIGLNGLTETMKLVEIFRRVDESAKEILNHLDDFADITSYNAQQFC